jgi:hypothetical protein
MILNAKQRAFETSITRESSLFERVKIKTVILHDQIMSSNETRVVHCADSPLEEERNRRIISSRKTRLSRDRELERDRRDRRADS